MTREGAGLHAAGRSTSTENAGVERFPSERDAFVRRHAIGMNISERVCARCAELRSLAQI